METNSKLVKLLFDAVHGILHVITWFIRVKWWFVLYVQPAQTLYYLLRSVQMKEPIMKSASGQVIVGGRSHHDTEIFSSIELFPRPPSKACQIPNDPSAQLKREGHSLSLVLGSMFVICGGSDGSNDLDSCISWSAGKASWTHLFTMRYLYMVTIYAA